MTPKTLIELQDYANASNNVWLKKKLELLELEIDQDILKSKIEIYDYFKGVLKSLDAQSDKILEVLKPLLDEA